MASPHKILLSIYGGETEMYLTDSQELFFGMAFEPESSPSEVLLNHLKNCAPCLDELRKLRARIANDQD